MYENRRTTSEQTWRERSVCLHVYVCMDTFLCLHMCGILYMRSNQPEKCFSFQKCGYWVHRCMYACTRVHAVASIMKFEEAFVFVCGSECMFALLNIDMVCFIRQNIPSELFPCVLQRLADFVFCSHRTDCVRV
jgi:hypothetical protein